MSNYTVELTGQELADYIAKRFPKKETPKPQEKKQVKKDRYIRLKDGFVIQTDKPENWEGCEILTDKEGKELQAENAKQSLLNILKKGDTVYTVLRHVSRSGMMRRIDLYTFQDSKKVYLTGYYALMKGETPPRDGYRVGGCGMDMGFHLVHGLSYRLFGDDYALRHEWI